MTEVACIARLNVLIEMFSECAEATDLETLLRVAAGRLRWIVDFDRCTFALRREGEVVCWIASRSDDALRGAVLSGVPEPEASLLGRVLASGAPAGWPGGNMCIPLRATGHTLGAFCLVTEKGVYTHRDVRLGPSGWSTTFSTLLA